MNQPTEALTKSETSELMSLVASNDLPVSQLACEFSRQHGAGSHTSPNGRKWAISYDLSLCTYCGNLEPQEPACPAKLRRLQERLLGSPPIYVRCWKCSEQNAVRSDLVQFDCDFCDSTNYARDGKWETC